MDHALHNANIVLCDSEQLVFSQINVKQKINIKASESTGNTSMQVFDYAMIVQE